MANNTFDVVIVWDNLGSAVRVRPGGKASVVDPVTGAPVTVVQAGQSTTVVTADSAGRATFTAEQGAVKLLSGGLSVIVYSAERAAASGGGGGSGTVTAVAGVSPDGTGNVPLTAANIGAVPTTRTVTAGTGLTGGGDLTVNRTLTVAYGTTTGTAAQGNDTRLSDARTPTAHKTSHATGGSDVLTPADIGAVPTAQTIAAAPGSPGYLGEYRVTYATTGTSPAVREFWYDGGGVANIASFWLNENGAPRCANPKPGDSALKVIGWGATSQSTPTLIVQQRSTDGGTSRVDQWGINKDGQPIIGSNNTVGCHVIKLAVGAAIPAGVPANVLIVRV